MRIYSEIDCEDQGVKEVIPSITSMTICRIKRNKLKGKKEKEEVMLMLMDTIDSIQVFKCSGVDDHFPQPLSSWKMPLLPNFGRYRFDLPMN